MSAGAYRHPFIILSPPATSDGRGGRSGDWTRGATLRGSLELLAADERLEGGGARGGATHRVVAHYRSGIDASLRLDLDGREFEIVSAEDPDGRRRRLELEVSEVKT